MESFKEHDFNRLSVVGKGDELHVYVNEKLTRTIKDAELKQGVYGTIGLGIGNYCFDNFTLYEPMDELPE